MGIRILVPRPQRGRRSLRGRRVLWLAAGAAAWGLGYAIFGATGLVGVYRTEAKVDDLAAQVQAARTANEALRERVRELRSDPEAIEREARERLGLVKEGDTVYFLPKSPTDDVPVPADSGAPADGAEAGPVRQP